MSELCLLVTQYMYLILADFESHSVFPDRRGESLSFFPVIAIITVFLRLKSLDIELLVHMKMYKTTSEIVNN